MSDNGQPGYIVYKINARVFKSYKGDIGKGSEVVYHYFLEGITPPEKGIRHIANFNKKNVELVIHDTGYHFEYSEGLDKLFEKTAK